MKIKMKNNDADNNDYDDTENDENVIDSMRLWAWREGDDADGLNDQRDDVNDDNDDKE